MSRDAILVPRPKRAPQLPATSRHPCRQNRNAQNERGRAVDFPRRLLRCFFRRFHHLQPAAGMNRNHLHIQLRRRRHRARDRIGDVMKFQIEKNRSPRRAHLPHQLRSGAGEERAANLESPDHWSELLHQFIRPLDRNIQRHNYRIRHAKHLNTNIFSREQINFTWTALVQVPRLHFPKSKNDDPPKTNADRFARIRRFGRARLLPLQPLAPTLPWDSFVTPFAEPSTTEIHQNTPKYTKVDL